jgi:hypothetical protein
MSGVPYYRIVTCCDNDQDGLFNIPNASLPLSGTFVYNGAPTISGGVNFQTGYCYTITYQGAVFNLYPKILDV